MTNARIVHDWPVHVVGIVLQHLRRSVRQPFVLSPNDAADPSRLAEVAQLDPRKVGFENKYVVEFDVAVHQIPRVHVLQSGSQLSGHSFCVQLSYSRFGNVRRQVPERCVFLREDVETGGFERYVVGRYDVSMGAQMQAVVEFPVEITQGRVRFRQGFQHHFGVGRLVFHEQNFPEPSFSDDLQNVEFFGKIYLQQTINDQNLYSRFGRRVATYFAPRLVEVRRSSQTGAIFTTNPALRPAVRLYIDESLETIL